MAQQIGIITNISGQFFAKTPNGNIKILKQGDFIFQNEQIINNGGQKIIIALNNNELLIIEEDIEKLILDDSVISTDLFLENEITLDIQALRKTLLDGENIENLEATAAGEDGAISTDLHDARFINTISEGSIDVEMASNIHGIYDSNIHNKDNNILVSQKTEIEPMISTQKEQQIVLTPQESQLSTEEKPSIKPIEKDITTTSKGTTQITQIDIKPLLKNTTSDNDDKDKIDDDMKTNKTNSAFNIEDEFDTLSLEDELSLNFDNLETDSADNEGVVTNSKNHIIQDLKTSDTIDIIEKNDELFIDGNSQDRVELNKTEWMHKIDESGNNITKLENGAIYNVYVNIDNSTTLNIGSDIAIEHLSYEAKI